MYYASASYTGCVLQIPGHSQLGQTAECAASEELNVVHLSLSDISLRGNIFGVKDFILPCVSF